MPPCHRRARRNPPKPFDVIEGGRHTGYSPFLHPSPAFVDGNVVALPPGFFVSRAEFVEELKAIDRNVQAERVANPGRVRLPSNYVRFWRLGPHVVVSRQPIPSAREVYLAYDHHNLSSEVAERIRRKWKLLAARTMRRSRQAREVTTRVYRRSAVG